MQPLETEKPRLAGPLGEAWKEVGSRLICTGGMVQTSAFPLHRGCCSITTTTRSWIIPRQRIFFSPRVCATPVSWKYSL